MLAATEPSVTAVWLNARRVARKTMRVWPTRVSENACDSLWFDKERGDAAHVARTASSTARGDARADSREPPLGQEPTPPSHAASSNAGVAFTVLPRTVERARPRSETTIASDHSGQRAGDAATGTDARAIPTSPTDTSHVIVPVPAAVPALSPSKTVMGSMTGPSRDEHCGSATVANGTSSAKNATSDAEERVALHATVTGLPCTATGHLPSVSSSGKGGAASVTKRGYRRDPKLTAPRVIFRRIGRGDELGACDWACTEDGETLRLGELL